MSLSIKNHILSSEKYKITDWTKETAKKNSKTYRQAGGQLDTLIMHYTGGRSGESSAKYLIRPEVKASAHIVIDKSGAVYQLVPFNKVAWHAGVSSYGHRSGFNKYSIGIEMDNAGVLTKVGNEFQAWFGVRYPENEVLHATHRNESSPRYWHTYTPELMEVAQEIAELLVKEYNLNSILGHEEISPGRKQDPGPAFELDKFRDMILTGRDVDESVTASNLPSSGVVAVDKLNIRSGSSTSFDKVAKPLSRGLPVEILEEKDGWVKVKTSVTGWVKKDFVTTK